MGCDPGVALTNLFLLDTILLRAWYYEVVRQVVLKSVAKWRDFQNIIYTSPLRFSLRTSPCPNHVTMIVCLLMKVLSFFLDVLCII